MTFAKSFEEDLERLLRSWLLKFEKLPEAEREMATRQVLKLLASRLTDIFERLSDDEKEG